MAIGTGDLYRGEIHWVMANQRCVNVYHFRALQNSNSAGTWNAAMDNLLDRLQAIATQMANTVHSSVSYDLLNVTGIHSGSGLHSRQRSININGGGSGELLPGFVAVPFFLSTDFAGRSRRGRSHVGGWIEDDQNAGVLVTSGSTKAEALRLVIEDRLTLNSVWRGVVYSRKIAKDTGLLSNQWPPQVEGDPTTPWANINQVSFSPILGSMYSRRIGRGS